MQQRIGAKIPIRTVSESNQNEHWTKKSRRAKKQKTAVGLFLGWAKGDIRLPCKVALTRRAPRKLDDDNLRGALKAVRDAVADIIRPGLAPGRADDSEHIAWEYAQEKGDVREYAAIIEISWG
jgi:hypothetical protein